MNKFIGIGRLTKDVELRYSQGENSTAVARYTLAVDRKGKNNATADFIPCIAFGKSGEFAANYFKKGMKVAIVGHLQSGSYENKEGNRVFTLDVIVDEQEFCESKKTEEQGMTSKPTPSQAAGDGFMYGPDTIDDSEIPFA